MAQAISNRRYCKERFPQPLRQLLGVT
jgi:hypothetical protein